MDALTYIIAGVALLPAACLLEAVAGMILIAIGWTFFVLPYKLARKVFSWVSR